MISLEFSGAWSASGVYFAHFQFYWKFRVLLIVVLVFIISHEGNAVAAKCILNHGAMQVHFFEWRSFHFQI